MFPDPCQAPISMAGAMKHAYECPWTELYSELQNMACNNQQLEWVDDKNHYGYTYGGVFDAMKASLNRLEREKPNWQIYTGALL